MSFREFRVIGWLLGEAILWIGCALWLDTAGEFLQPGQTRIWTSQNSGSLCVFADSRIQLTGAVDFALARHGFLKNPAA
jgi:hypothetical protein